MPLTPSQVADTLETAPSTIRRWSTRFEEFMSFSHSPGQRRSYTLEDLAMLRRIRDLSREGVPLAKISEALTVEAVRAEGPTKALINMSDVAQALEMARDAYASIELKNAELQERVSALEEYIQTPWWRRKKAPKKGS